jgi:hypothetical protein
MRGFQDEIGSWIGTPTETAMTVDGDSQCWTGGGGAAWPCILLDNGNGGLMAGYYFNLSYAMLDAGTDVLIGDDGSTPLNSFTWFLDDIEFYGTANQVFNINAPALEWARRNLQLNCLVGQRVELVCEDAGRYLANCAQQFDLIVLDPPPLARSRKDAARAQRLYVEMNQLAMRAMAPGAMLMTFSCSQHFRGEDFFNALRIAQVRAGRNLRMLERLGPGPDHPVMLGHVEGDYLTGALLARLD